MGGLSVEQLLEFDMASELSEEQLLELYSGVDALDQDATKNAEKSQLSQLFLRAQYVMRSKQAQLTVAMEEIDKLAGAAGENEVLKERNADLQKLVNKFKAKGTDSRGVDLRTEVEELQTARNQLKKDLKTKQRQLDDEKRENDKLSSRLEELESERRELRRQLEQLNDTVDQMRGGYHSRSDPEETGEHQYAELVRQKNQYINVLLDDCEAHEREKVELRSQLAPLKDQLADATRQIETMTAEFDDYRRQCRPVNDEGGGSEAARTIQRLEAEVAELRTIKDRRDGQFDQLSAIVEQRTDEFKRLITARDAEIEALEVELRRASSKPVQPTTEVDSDKRRIAELERQCEQQRRQLAAQQADLRRATAEMEAVTVDLEQSQLSNRATTGGDPPPSSLLVVRADLSRAEAQVRQLMEQLDNTERQAAGYNDQVTELTVRLREVMEGEFGLAEAVGEIKEAQRQIGVRDRQVAEQNSFINLVQRHLTELVDENTALRSRLGMEPHDAAQLVANHAGKEKLVHVLEREVEKLEEERIALKLENRKLSGQLRSGGQSGLSPDEIRDICRQRKQFWDYVRRLGPAPSPADQRQTPAAELLRRVSTQESELSTARQRLAEADRTAALARGENDKLRQGMREILQSIREQDAVSAVKVAAPSLEMLLQALDTRGLVGEYHPALVPYSALQQLEGRNEELRHQLRDARLECRSISGVAVSGGGGGGGGGGGVVELLSAGLTLPAHLTASSSQLIGQLTAQLTVALKALDEHGRDGQQTRTELETLRHKFTVFRHQMGLLYEQRAADADRWQEERHGLQQSREEADTENQILKAQLQQLEAGALALQAPADEQHNRTAETHRQMALRVSELLRAERRLRLLTAERQELVERLRRADTEQQQAQLAATGRIAALQGDKKMMAFQLSVLQRELEKSAPLSKVTEVNDKVDEVTSKYATLLSNQEKLLCEERTSRLLESELTLLRQQLAGLQTADTDHHVPARSAADETALKAQLAEMTSREKQQRMRADHAERMAHLLKDQLSEAEGHASELERRVTELAESGAAGRLALARLADQLMEPAVTSDQAELDLQSRLVCVEGERDRLKDTLDLATTQLEYLRVQKHAAEQATDALRRETAQLQDSDDLRAVIASLHQRLLGGERSAAELKSQLSGSQAALSAARARIYQTETEAARVRVQMSGLKTTHAQKMRTVRLVVQELRGCLSLPQRALQERLCQTVADLLTRRQTLQKQLTAAQVARDEAEGERDGVKSQKTVLDQALTELKAGTLDIRPWIERCQTVELEVTSLRLRAERLTAECSHVRGQLAEEERRATEAESTICRLKNQLELRLIDQQLESRCPREQPTPSRQPPAVTGGGRHSRLPVRLAGRPSTAPENTLSPDTAVVTAAATAATASTATAATAATSTAAATDSGTGSSCHTANQHLRAACEQHVAAVRALMTSLDSRHDVTALEWRLSAALEGPTPAVQLLLTSADVIRMWCDVRPGDATPSPTGTYSIPSPQHPVPPPLAVDDPPADRRRLRLAQTAAASLEQRLRQKEQSVAEYRRLLGEARQQAADQADQHRQQLARASDQLRQQMALVVSLQAESSARSTPPVSAAQLSGSQLSRLHESSELLAEQERAIGALMERLRQSREEESRYRERVTRLESERRDTAELLQRTVSSLTEERSRLRDQLTQERRQAAAATEARLQAQSQAQAGLVQRLREIMLKKERQHHALARVLRDVKAEILETVEQAALLDQQTKEEPAGQELTNRSTVGSGGLQGQLTAAQRELDSLKNELNDRTLQCHRLQAELHEAERRRREDGQRLQRQLEAAKQKLRAAQESQTAPSHKPASDPAKIQEELAKWDERKKWQKTVEKLKARLRERETECERQQALGAGLRDTIHRLERDKAGYEAKIRTLTGLMSEERYHALERDNQLLKEQVAQLRGSESADSGAQLEQLRQQVHTLTSRLATQQAAAKQGKSAASNVARFEAELTQSRVKTQQLEEENTQLKTEIAELRQARESSEGGGGGGGDAEGWPGAPTPAPAPAPAALVAEAGTVSILRRLVERLRADNLRLRRQLLRHTVTSTTEEQVELMRTELNCAVAERDNMAAQLQRLRTMEPRQH